MACRLHVAIMVKVNWPYYYMISFLNNPYITLAALFLSIASLVSLAILAWRFSKYKTAQSQLLEGEEVGNLQEIVLKHKKTLATHNKNLRELGVILEQLVDQNRLNMQKAGLVRFNPFPEAGGNMSFALALLDGNDSGIVISSLHAREGTRIYSKNITSGKADTHLTDEEKEAIEKARKQAAK